MIRLSKLSDYAIVVLTEMARAAPGATCTVPVLAARSSVPEPTVAKLMKALARGGVVLSHRGILGGYALARQAERISVADIISALEGPIALTECVGHDEESGCSVHRVCTVRGNWDKINQALVAALQSVSLAEMAEPHIPAAFMAERESA